MKNVSTFIISIGLSSALIACAPTTSGTFLSRSGTSYDQFMKDRYSCIVEAKIDVRVDTLIYFNCMNQKGYKQSIDGFRPPKELEVTMFPGIVRN